MSPKGLTSGRKIIAFDNLYTVMIAIAVVVVLVSAVFVAYKCYSQYDTIFKIP